MLWIIIQDARIIGTLTELFKGARTESVWIGAIRDRCEYEISVISETLLRLLFQGLVFLGF